MSALTPDIPTQRALKRATRLSGDGLFKALTAVCAALVLVVLAGMLIKTTAEAWPAFSKEGLGFVTTNDWVPSAGRYGGAAFIYGTMLTSVIAVILAVPMALLIALFLTDVAPRRLRLALGYLVDLLAAVPSVVYGLWGVIVMVPFLTEHVWQPMSEHLGFIPFFDEFLSGRNFATAGVILAIMILPIVSPI